jgi:Pyruvate/2-oxoacid:ferredoxin oxidoreductase delta subunit
MSCAIRERFGTIHCANCLTGSFILKEGEHCPDGIKLESLPLEKARTVAYPKGCGTCREKAVEAAATN